MAIGGLQISAINDAIVEDELYFLNLATAANIVQHSAKNAIEGEKVWLSEVPPAIFREAVVSQCLVKSLVRNYNANARQRVPLDQVHKLKNTFVPFFLCAPVELSSKVSCLNSLQVAKAMLIEQFVPFVVERRPVPSASHITGQHEDRLLPSAAIVHPHLQH